MRSLFPLFVFAVFASDVRAELDGNTNLQSDVWEMVFGAVGLTSAGDEDGDGWSNAEESRAGTNPLDGAAFPRLWLESVENDATLFWQGIAGKRYAVLETGDLGTWTPLVTDLAGTGNEAALDLADLAPPIFFRLAVSDVDGDSDGVSDWEELAVGFDPFTTRTGRFSTTDAQRIAGGLAAANSLTVSTYDDTCAERWPDSAVFVLRRAGGLQPLDVSISLGGSAGPADYTASSTTQVAFAPGKTEAFVEITPLADADDAEGTETVALTLLPGAGYAIGSADTTQISILNTTDASGPSAKEAARFLIQAAFGPDQDSADDPDQIPENVEEVMNMGIEPWIDDQLERPVGHLVPMVEWQNEQPSSAAIYNDRKMNAWWGRAMGLPKLRPDAIETQLPDPLRQRVAFALSQIFVISDRMERLGVEPVGMTHFYDTLLEHSFGNYQDLLRAVSLHPCMGIYLSHLGNRKSDPVAKTFPDENYAREIMQLFSIGLWMLDDDGSVLLDENDKPIPTYDNSDITEFARVFTGLSYGALSTGGTVTFGAYDGDFTVPMAGWDAEHDLAPKNLLLGEITPARAASPGNTGTATMADVDAAVANLFNHPNVGPFIGRLLIQRLVTSNPSPAYVGRVSAAFNAEPRGDLGRVVKAILMDPEARDPAMMTDPGFGKLREPFLRAVNVARAFNASSQEGWYYLDAFVLDHAQEPLKSPSVFNFYLPTYTPPGPLAQAGLVAPEMQIVNASSGTTAPNYFWNSITGGLHRWGSASPERNVTLNLDQETLLNVPPEAVGDPSPPVAALDPDPLIRRLDLVLTGGALEPETCRIIREALVRIGPGSGWEWPENRLKLAIYLIVNSPEFAVQQ